MHRIVNDEALDTLFRAPRADLGWLARPVGDTLLRALWELVKLGPSSGLAGRVRIVFAKSEDAKARLALAVPEADRAAIVTAPVAAIVAGPSGDRHGSAAVRDGALHAAYLILAARALGLDCRPIWQFDTRIVDTAFFPASAVASNFLCALGYGDDSQLSPDRTHPGFDEACSIL